MKILFLPSATVAAELPNPPHDIRQTVADEPVPGFFRKISLGPDGVLVQHGDAQVLFPLEDLLRLATLADPAFIPPTEPTRL